MKAGAGLLLLFAVAAGAQSFPDNTDWAAVLSRYVSAQHRVDYKSLKTSGPELLERYTNQLRLAWPRMDPAARKAALINAYNALTMLWVTKNYPIESIWNTKKPFQEKRHTVNGGVRSLDDIEAELRAMDPRVHAALVCAALSCPPLRREPYRADAVNQQLDDNLREWLAMPDRNRFDAVTGTAFVSKIFDWYRGDFDRIGGVVHLLSTYGPPPARKISRVEYLPYRWGLNDTSGIGDGYADWKFYRDRIFN